MTRLGIIVALAAETRTLIPLRHKGEHARWGDACVMLAGAGPDNARAAAECLVREHGVSALLSWGCCAALDRSLRPGHLLAPATVIDDTQAYDATHFWQQHLYQRLAGPLTVSQAPLIQSPHIVASPNAKSALAVRSGAAAVDMESAAVAAVAQAHTLPYAVLRAVADPAELAVPPAVLAHTDADGITHVPHLLGHVLRNPSQIPDLIALGRHFNAALTTLKHAAQHLQTDLLPAVSLHP